MYRRRARRPVSTGVAYALLAGCGGVTGRTISPAPDVKEHRQQTAVVERVVHIFGAPGDGAEPVARLLNMNGILYGTTSVGGNARQYGTIFAILPNGQEKSVYITAAEGGNIMAGLTKVGGLLYGTTAEGGVNGQGVVYSLEANTAAPPRGETDIYSFPYGYSGAWPNSDLIYANGKLYGTTKFGGYQGGTREASSALRQPGSVAFFTFSATRGMEARRRATSSLSTVRSTAPRTEGGQVVNLDAVPFTA